MTNDHITHTELKSTRGWTDSLIKAFLGEPDKLAVNPHYRSGFKIRLYAIERVINAEAAADYQAAIARKAPSRAKLKAASKAIADKKRADLLTAIERLQVSVIKLPPVRIRADAIKNYNDLWVSRGEFAKRASVDSPPEFLNRITRNYIRHNLTTLTLGSL